MLTELTFIRMLLITEAVFHLFNMWLSQDSTLLCNIHPQHIYRRSGVSRLLRQRRYTMLNNHSLKDSVNAVKEHQRYTLQDIHAFFFAR